MECTKKHKNLIARLFKKAGMLKEAKRVLSCDDYKHEIANAMRDAAQKTKTPIGANPALLDAARRYENRDCAIFKECTLRHCEGGVWCSIYNLGGSHGQIGSAYSHLGKTVAGIPLRKRRKLMLQMLEYTTSQKSQKLSEKGSKKEAWQKNN
jgi:hypothetical protein